MNQALKIQMRSFFNSFVRDFADEAYVDLSQEFLVIKLDNTSSLKIEIDYFSLVGAHFYKDKIEKISHEVQEINFHECLNLLNSCLNIDDDFIFYVENSYEFLKQVLEQAPVQNVGEMNYTASEQSLLFGHPFHPYPKAKIGMSYEDINSYSPEFQKTIHLLWVALPKEIMVSNIDFTHELAKLKKFDLPKEYINESYFPYHPWQWQQICLKNPKYVNLKTLNGKNEFAILSSMRSVYNESAPYCLKFSLDLKLTNSIRHLQPEEAGRGKHLKDVSTFLKLDNKFPTLKIIHEPFYISFTNLNGEVVPEGMIQFRENSYCLRQKKYLLSTLVEYDERIGNTRLNEFLESNKIDIEKWFTTFLDVSFTPIMELGTKYGIYLGAHLQNIILELDNGLPVQTYFRDCQGTGYDKNKLNTTLAFYPELKNDHGNILDSDDVNHVFGYYLVVNTLFGVIAALSVRDKDIEKKLLNTFYNRLLTQKNPFANFLTQSPKLAQKGNFRCSVEKYNENTIDKPWSIYNMIDNPISLNSKKSFSDGILYQSELKNGWCLSYERFNLDKHLEIFHKWHNQDYVSNFWEMNFSIEKLQKHIEDIYKNPYHEAVILNIDNQPVGYYEVYWATEDRIAPFCSPKEFDRGIHLLIGEKKYLKTTLAYESIFHISKFLFEFDDRTQNIWGEPRADNKAILHLAEQLPGWEFIKEFSFPHKRAALLCCSKENFLKDIEE